MAAIVTQLVVAKILGAEAFGHFSYAIGLASTIGLAVKLGYDSAATKFLSVEDRFASRFSAIFYYLTGRSIGWGFVGIPIFIGAAVFSRSMSSLETLLAVPTVIISGAVLVVRNSLIASDRTVGAAFLEGHARNWLFLVLVIVSPLFGVARSYNVAILYFSITMMLAFFLLFVEVWRSLAPTRSVLDGAEKRIISRYSWTLGGTAIVSALWTRADILLVALFATDWRLIGAYAVASRLRVLAASIDTILDPIFSPWIARAFSTTGWTSLRDICLKYNIVAALWSALVLLLVLGLGSHFLGLLGNDYKLSFNFLVVFLAAQLLRALIGPVHLLLTMTDLERASFIASIAAFVSYIIVSLILGHVWGIWGLTYGTAFGVLVRPVYQRVILAKTRPRGSLVASPASVAEIEIAG
jgi:O-antigen/teichoic acid export membrane protein